MTHNYSGLIEHEGITFRKEVSDVFFNQRKNITVSFTAYKAIDSSCDLLCFSVYDYQHPDAAFITYTDPEELMALLIPDRTRDNQEDFVWCVPIARSNWKKWYELSTKFKRETPKQHGAVRYMYRMEGKKVTTILMLPTLSQSDDDVMTACAYLRLVKQLSCRMYVVRCTDDALKGAALVNAVVGADPKLMAEVADPGDDEKMKPL